MELTVFTESRCALNAAGTVCTLDSPRAYPFWARYLECFSRVTVVARLAPHTIDGPALTGPGVCFSPLPHYSGPAQHVIRMPAIQRALQPVCERESAFILRLPGRVGGLAGHVLRRAARPYAVEVAGDPADVFRRGSIEHPLRPLFRRVFAADLRWLTRHAVAAAYVTERTLQQRYPCPGFTIAFSSVDLGPAAFAPAWKRARAEQRSFHLVTVGSLAQLYKGPDVLLAALAQLVAHDIDVNLAFVGDGRFRPRLEAQAAALGLHGRVEFRGHVPAGAPVCAELDAADLFVLPSRAEGLPRALIEAMARGLPCLASRVGGIPELLAAEDLVPPGDSSALAGQIEDALLRPARRNRMAERNHVRARDFRSELLAARRREFYQQVGDRTRAALRPARR
jgi:glycosyltransferase involved in cell wall biosynthesis